MASDTFTNDDGTELATHNASWTWSRGDLNSYAKIYSNAIRIDATREIAFYYSGSQTDYSKVTVKANQNSDDRNGPAVRVNAGQNGYHAYFLSPSGGNWTTVRLMRNADMIDEYAGSWAVASDHIVEISASGTGATVTVVLTVDGSQVVSYPDTNAARITSGYSGIRLYSVSANVLAFDDWTDTQGAAWQYSIGMRL